MGAIEDIMKVNETRSNELVIEDHNLTDLPVELWQLTNLTSLEIKNCYNLENLPAEISQLINLRSFKITRSRISSFPVEFWRLVNLNSLDICVCPRLETIPGEIGLLANLTSLRITGCETLENLPQEIAQIVNLTSLRIINCKQIKLLSLIDKLPNLTFLEIEENCKISEKSFPQGVPADIQGSILRVVNAFGETVALFISNDELLKEANKSTSPEEYCMQYDQLYDDYCNWDNAGINLNNQDPEEQEEDYRKVLQNLSWNTYILMRIKIKGHAFLLQALSRLAYPYHCQVEQVEKSIDQLKKNIDWYLGDIQVLRKASEFDCVELKFLMQEIITTGWIYDHPEYWLTDKNIDTCVDYAAENKHVEVVAFLLDYKNRHFPIKGAATLDFIGHDSINKTE
jgi:hypothetical protein